MSLFDPERRDQPVSTSVLLADDHYIVRQGVRRIVEALPDLHVVAEACDGEEAVQLAIQRRPDVAIVDLAMPRLSGTEAIRRIRQRTATRCIAFSMHDTQAHVTHALQAGAAAYVVKSADGSELVDAIGAVRSGRSYLSPSIAHWAVAAIVQPSGRTGSSFGSLTGREREVLQLVAEGLSSKEIAVSLGVSTKTIETHRSNLMGKLNIRKASKLVRVAIQEGLVTP